MSILNHFSVSLRIVPSAIAAWIACVEHRLELRVVLAHADGDAAAEHVAVEARSGDDDVLELRLLGGRRDGGMRREDRVDAAGREIEIMLLGRLVFADRDRVLEVLLEEGRVRGRGLHADRLALEQRLPGLDHLLAALGVRVEVEARTLPRELRERGILRRAPAVRSARVDAREVDHLEPFVGDVHARHDGVVLLGRQRRDDAVPVLRDDLAFHLHARAKIVGEVDLESVELAARGLEVPGRIGALGRDLDRFPFLALGGGGPRAEHRGKQAEADNSCKFHHCSPGCGFVRAFDWRATRQTRFPRRVGQANRQRRRGRKSQLCRLWRLLCRFPRRGTGQQKGRGPAAPFECRGCLSSSA